MDVSRFERLLEVPPGLYSGSHLKSYPGSYEDFLSRLWALYGPPSGDMGLFYYDIYDRETGLFFSASASDSGLGFGDFVGENPEDLMPILDAFEQLMDQTEPIDCQFRLATDYGVYSFGRRGGLPFSELVEGIEDEDEDEEMLDD